MGSKEMPGIDDKNIAEGKIGGEEGVAADLGIVTIETATVNADVMGTGVLARDFVPHPEDCRDVEVGHDPTLGREVVATKNIPAGTVIAVFDGPQIQAPSCMQISDPHIRDHVVQIGKDEFIYAADGLAGLVKHSCEPNCGIQEGKKIVTMRPIQAGEPLRWNYGMANDSDQIEECACGSTNCLGLKLPYRLLPQDRKDQLQPFISEWILEKHREQRPFNSIDLGDGIHVIELSDSEHMTYERAKELADKFRFVFCNNADFNWGQYAFCATEGCDTKLAACDVFPNEEGVVGDKSYDVPLDQIDGKLPSQLPDCPCCGERMRLHHDPKKTLDSFLIKAARDYWAVVIRDKNKGAIDGILAGYKAPWSKTIQREEFLDPHYYSADLTKEERERGLRDPDLMLKELSVGIKSAIEKGMSFRNAVFGDDGLLSPEIDVLSFNCFLVDRPARSNAFSGALITTAASFVRDGDLDIPCFSETSFGSRSHGLMVRGGSFELPGVLNNGNQDLKAGDPMLLVYPGRIFHKDTTRKQKK